MLNGLFNFRIWGSCPQRNFKTEVFKDHLLLSDNFRLICSNITTDPIWYIKEEIYF